MLRIGRSVVVGPRWLALSATLVLVALAATDPARAATTTVASTAQLQSAVASAAPGGVVEVAGGSYGAVTLSAARSAFVTVRPVAGQAVTLAGLSFGASASYIRIEDVTVSASVTVAAGSAHHIQLVGSDVRGVAVRAGAHDILVDHNDIHDCGNCVEAASVDPTVHGSPCATCTAQAPISNLTVSANRIVDPGTDAFYVGNFRNLVVADNEIVGVTENGDHSDCLQSTFGGDGLVFRGNYVHDNRCQGFFIKDGRVTNVTVQDNLFAKNTKPCGAGVTCDPGAPYTFQVYDTIGIAVRNNTFAQNAGGETFRERSNAGIAFDHNVLYGFGPYDDQGPDYGDYYHQAGVMTEDYDVGGFASTWPSSYRGAHDVANASPAFRDAPHGDYRLVAAVTAGGATYTPGVTWAVADKQFGRAGAGSAPSDPTPPSSNPTPPPAEPAPPASQPPSVPAGPSGDPPGDASDPPTLISLPPTVALTAPDAPAGRTLRLAANPSVGVVEVEFWIDRTRVASDARTPYAARVDLDGLRSGTHTVSARAFDARGRAASAAVTIRVSRSGGRARAAALSAKATGARATSTPADSDTTRLAGQGPRQRTVKIALTRCDDGRGAVADSVRLRADARGRLDGARAAGGLCVLTLEPPADG
jgi:Right handed beta helix region/Bacterial Ig domain